MLNQGIEVVLTERKNKVTLWKVYHRMSVLRE